MEEKIEKIKPGTWSSMINRVPKVTFELNIPQTVSFLENEPREDTNNNDGGVYYTFSVIHNDQPTVIQTSAITLLAELSKHNPLQGKTLKITKKTNKGKQFFVAEVM